MPTMPASAPMRPRICSASERTSCSGSGSDVDTALRMIEVALQDDGGCDRVDVGGARRAVHGLANLRLGFGGGERLVDHHHRTLVARREAPCELPGEARDLVRRAGGVVALAGDEGAGPPFGLEPVDRLQAALVAPVPAARNGE